MKRERIKDFSQFSRESFEKIRYDAKTVSLRFPGAILIEVLPPFEFFKIAEARKQKPRSDGTNVQSECILSPELFPIINDDRTGKERKQRQINIYKIGEESEVNRALGLLERLIREEKRLVEVE